MIYRILVSKRDYLKEARDYEKWEKEELGHEEKSKGCRQCGNRTVRRVYEWGKTQIRCSQCDLVLSPQEATRITGSYWEAPSYRLGGPWAVDGPFCMPFKFPKKSFSRRARFYFTEKGWNLYGRDMCKQAYEWGYQNGCNIQVIKRKNPHRGEVAYRDDIQVAVLPKRKKNK